MGKPTLYRASMDVTTEGREMLGLAVRWDLPALVRDPGKAPYLESFTRSSADETLRRNPEPRPFFYNHEYKFNPAAQPIGIATFRPSAEGLVFRALASKTRKGDEALELAHDGAAVDVSLGFFPVQQSLERSDRGLVTVRTEIGIRELSQAPTGFAQHPGAKVLAMRAVDDSFSDIRESVEDALEAMLWPTTGEEPLDQYLCICDMGDTWAVYTVGGEVSEEAEGLWRIEYARDDAGQVALTSDPQAVEMQYVAVAPEEPANPMAQRSADPAETAVTGTPALDELRRYRRRNGF
jgi:phage head maturation protease